MARALKKQEKEAEHADALRKLHDEHLQQLEQLRARLGEVVLQRDGAIRTAASAGREARDASQRAATEMQLLAQLEFAHDEEVKEMKQGWDRAMRAQEQLKQQLGEAREALATSEQRTAASEKLLQEAQDRIIELDSRCDTTAAQQQNSLQSVPSVIGDKPRSSGNARHVCSCLMPKRTRRSFAHGSWKWSL